MQYALNMPGLLLSMIARLIILPPIYAAGLLFIGFLLMGPLGSCLALLVAMIVATMNLRLRRQRGWTVIYYIEQAVRLNLPITQMLDAAAESERGRLRRRLRRLNEALAAGGSLGESLGRTTPEIDDRALYLILAAQNTGQLAPTLRWLLTPADEQAESDGALRRYVWLYPAVLAVVIMLVVAFISVIVLPKLVEIFQDFDAPLPPITQRLIDLVYIDFVGWSWAAIASMAMMGGLWLWVTWATFCPRWLNLRMWPGVDALLWYTPVLGPLTRDRDLRDVMRVLGSATAAGLSLETALTETMQLRVNSMTRRKLLRWRDAIESGAAVDEAARQARLPRLVSGMIATVRKTDQLPRAIEYLSRYYEDKFSRAAALAGGAVVPTIELVFGVLVGWIALAAISPLFALLDAVTEGGL